MSTILKRGSKGDAVRELQTRLASIGRYSSKIDGDFGPGTDEAVRGFQRAFGLVADGIVGPKTSLELEAASHVIEAPSEPVVTRASVPTSWMPAAKMDRIIVHWTAGAHKASALDKAHYHILIEDDGSLVRGTPSITLNDRSGLKEGYAAHTLNCNSGSIGVSLCCMAGAVESPFNAGSAPMTRAQWDTLAEVCAALCQRYSIPVTPETLLSHAEVQGTLGIKQRGKWDISRLAFDHSIDGAKACGDRLRAAVKALL